MLEQDRQAANDRRVALEYQDRVRINRLLKEIQNSVSPKTPEPIRSKEKTLFKLVVSFCSLCPTIKS